MASALREDRYLDLFLKNQRTIFEHISSENPFPEIFDKIINWIEAGQVSAVRATLTIYAVDGDEIYTGQPSDDHLKFVATTISTTLTDDGNELLGSLEISFDPSVLDLPKADITLRIAAGTSVAAIVQMRKQAVKSTAVRAYAGFDQLNAGKTDLHRLLMNAPALVAILKGPNHVFELANSLYLEVAGPGRTIVGKTVLEAMPELASQGIIELLDAVYQTGEPYYGNEVLIQLDREMTGQLSGVYFNFIYQAIKDLKGDVDGIFVHAVDVTELVKSRLRAENSEKMFRSFVLNSPMPIGIYVGREMRIELANDAVLEAWGKPASVRGKTFREALPELEGQPFYDLLDQVYTTGIPYIATEDRVDLVRNGKPVITYYNFIYKALRNERGEIYGVMNTAAEVTELVRAKQQLAETEENLRNAIEIAELATWSLDLQTNQIHFSNQVADWADLPPGGAPVSQLIDTIHPDDKDSIIRAIELSRTTGAVFDVEYRVIHPETRVQRTLLAKGKIFLHEKGETFLKGTARDVSLQKQTEEDLEQQVASRTAELEKKNIELNILNENLNQFAYIASHDLQEPLRKINVFSDMLHNRHNDDLPENGQMLLKKIADAARRMANLIKDLLNFSKVSLTQPFQKTDLNTLINQIGTDYELLINEKQARINIEPLCEIDALPLQMNQLFYNIIGNALKFSNMSVPPVIDISCRTLGAADISRYPSLTRTLDYCEIIVKDNGIGFDQVYAEQIFSIFQRLHDREQFEGTGIGLALCRKIVDLHHGEIFAVSQEGKGSSFHIILPIYQNQ